MHELHRLHQRFCDYSFTFKGNTPRTVKWLKETFGLWARFSKAKFIRDISRQSIENWIFQGKVEKNWSAKTIRNRLQSLSIFFDWLIKDEHLNENPILKIPKPKLPKRVPRHLSTDEALKLLEWTRNFPFDYKFERIRATAIIATFIYTGIRAEELRNLKMEEVDLENHTLFVNSGKGNKDRIVPLNSQLIPVLEDYLQDRRRMKKSCPYFFTAMRANQQMGDAVIKRLVWRLRDKSKIYFYPHMLRHTFATLMLEGGCDLFSLSKMLGHADIKTTTIYLSATTAHLQEQIKKHPLNF